MSNFTVEFLKRCEKVTTKYENENNWSIQDQLLHIYEEIAEVQDAYRTGPMEHLKEELCDVILASITMFHKLDVNQYEIQEAMENTLQKVESRTTKEEKDEPTC